MLDQISGRVLHIDFGDCFEVAMHREKVPEKVPFRLTRMLIKAMEVSGIEGSYRDTCERTMAVLRDNRDSLVAMLEAFVYDPLISWRLLGQSPNNMDNTTPLPTDPAAAGGMEPTITASSFAGGGGGGGERLERSVALSRSVAGAPIREDTNEDSTDDDNSSIHHNANTTRNVISAAAPGNESTAAVAATTTSQTLPDNGNALSNGNFLARRSESIHTSQMRSLRMFSEIQSLASNLNVSSRIASITGDSSVRNYAAESISRSRLDRSVRQREAMSIVGDDDYGAATEEALNEKALKVIRRVQDKLTGTDFHPPPTSTSSNHGGSGEDVYLHPLDVQDQVQRLIVQATSTENLCQLFIGWCAFW